MRRGQRLVVTAACLAMLGSAAPLAAKRAYLGPVPAGWSMDTAVQGDLTGDGMPDTAMVIRKIDPANITQNDRMGKDQLDTNPRRLLVYERTAKDYRLIGSSDYLIPSADDAETPCLADPIEEGGLSIAKQVLSVQLNYWLSCGSYGVTINTFKFRREARRFRLIGFDKIDFMRSSGQGTQYSVNFLTSRMAVSPWAIDTDGPPKWKWSRIKPQRHYLDSYRPIPCPVITTELSLC